MIEIINALAFYRTGITNITIPASVIKINGGAFGGGDLQKVFFCDTQDWGKRQYDNTDYPWISIS